MAMLEKIPTEKEMQTLIGTEQFDVWTSVCAEIDALYEMEHIWNSGGKKWKYEYKYRCGGKTLCALYAKEQCAGFMIIFGLSEREKVDAIRHKLSSKALESYDSATVYHDGKWVMFPLENDLIVDFIILLQIKRKPNKKIFF